MRFTLYAALAGAASAAALGEVCDDTASPATTCDTSGQECGATGAADVCKWTAAQPDATACVVKYYAGDCTSAYCAPGTADVTMGTCTAKPVLGAACLADGTDTTLGFTEGGTGMGSCATANGNECNSTSLTCKWTTPQAATAICATTAADCLNSMCSIATGDTLGTCMYRLGDTCTATTSGTPAVTTHDCGVTPAQGDQCTTATGASSSTCSWSAAQADGAVCMVAASPTHTGQSTDCTSSYCVVATGETIGVCTAKPTLGQACVTLTGSTTDIMGTCATGQGDTCTGTSPICDWSEPKDEGAACLTSDEKENPHCTDGWCDTDPVIPDGETFGLAGTCAKKPGLLKIEDADGKGYYETKTIWHLGSALLKCMMKFQVGCAMNTLFKNIGSLFKFF